MINEQHSVGYRIMSPLLAVIRLESQYKANLRVHYLSDITFSRMGVVTTAFSAQA
jgi:hypothetical protein